jgi:hypothetical protein
MGRYEIDTEGIVKGVKEVLTKKFPRDIKGSSPIRGK